MVSVWLRVGGLLGLMMKMGNEYKQDIEREKLRIGIAETQMGEVKRNGFNDRDAFFGPVRYDEGTNKVYFALETVFPLIKGSKEYPDELRIHGYCFEKEKVFDAGEERPSLDSYLVMKLAYEWGTGKETFFRSNYDIKTGTDSQERRVGFSSQSDFIDFLVERVSSERRKRAERYSESIGRVIDLKSGEVIRTK